MWFANYEQGITLPLKLKKAEVSGKNCSIDGSKLKLGKKEKGTRTGITTGFIFSKSQH